MSAFTNAVFPSNSRITPDRHLGLPVLRIYVRTMNLGRIPCGLAGFCFLSLTSSHVASSISDGKLSASLPCKHSCCSKVRLLIDSGRLINLNIFLTSTFYKIICLYIRLTIKQFSKKGARTCTSAEISQ